MYHHTQLIYIRFETIKIFKTARYIHILSENSVMEYILASAMFPVLVTSTHTHTNEVAKQTHKNHNINKIPDALPLPN